MNETIIQLFNKLSSFSKDTYVNKFTGTNVTCIIIFRILTTDGYGISEDGNWIIERNGQFLPISIDKHVAPCLPFLELKETDFNNILTSLNLSNELTEIIKTNFPLKEIVKIGLEQKSEYWANLAMYWIKRLNTNDMHQLINILHESSKAEWATQKTRNDAKKLIKQISRKYGVT